MMMEIVDTNQVQAEVESALSSKAEQVITITRQAEANAQKILALDLDQTDEKRKMVKAIDEFAADTLSNSARRSALFQTTIGNLSKSGEDASLISEGLAALQQTIQALDPSRIDFTKGGFMQRIINPIHRYFGRVEEADGTIQDILSSLDKGRITLKNDNTTLELEEDYLRDATKKLNAELNLGMAMNEYLESRVNDPSFTDEEKHRFVNDEILFPLRRRISDMQQMALVNYQCIIAMEVVKRSNKELIRGVDRAKTVTVTALRTAVMVAGAMYNQKIVMKNMDILNDTTDSLIASTGRMLRQQSAVVGRQTLDNAVSPDVLKRSFQDAISAIDEISTFKQRALPQMQHSIAQFRALAQAGENELSRFGMSL